jgi:hypothetical protein
MTIQKMRLILLKKDYILEESIIEDGIINIKLYKQDVDGLEVGAEECIEESEFLDATFYVPYLRNSARNITEHIEYRHSNHIGECNHERVHTVNGNKRVCADCMVNLGVQIVLNLTCN